jgi:hypothetical protein
MGVDVGILVAAGGRVAVGETVAVGRMVAVGGTSVAIVTVSAESSDWQPLAIKANKAMVNIVRSFI